MSTRHEKQPRALVDNMADPEQVAEAKEEEKSKTDSLRDRWRQVLGTYEGRHVLYSILDHCGALRSVMPTGSPIDPLALARNAGRQDVGHYLLAEVEQSDPDALSLMMSEHHQREQTNA